MQAFLHASLGCAPHECYGEDQKSEAVVRVRVRLRVRLRVKG